MLDSMFEHRVRKMARPTEEELGDDFSYIIRMADADVDGLKPLATALTSIKGIFNPKAKDFANEVPTKSEPIRPGPLVKATAESSFLEIPACFKA